MYATGRIVAQNRNRWKKVVEQARNLNRLQPFIRRRRKRWGPQV